MRANLILFYSLFSFFAGIFSGFSQGSSCGNLEPFCAGSDRLVFENSNFEDGSLEVAEPGPNFGCLETQPFPAWFYLQIEADGNLNFTISQFQNPDGSGAMLDVDFIVWGPFERTDDYCSNEALSVDNTIDCSYAPDTIERMNIPNARAGDIYVVLITNFERVPGYISLQQNNSGQPGAGSTDCTILESGLGPDQIICGETETVLNGATEGATSYEWYKLNEDLGEYELLTGETSPTLTVNSSGNYRLLVTEEITGNTDEDDVNVRFVDDPVANIPEDLFSCGDPNEGIDLTQRSEEILEGNTTEEDYEVIFFETRQAMESNEPIENAQDYIFQEDTQIFARVEGESGCVSEPVAMNLLIGETIEINLDSITILCVGLDGSLKEEVRIGEDLGSGYEYEWSNGENVVSENSLFTFSQIPEERDFSLKVTDVQTGCSMTFRTQIELYSAPEEVVVNIEGSDFTGGYVLTAEAVSGENRGMFEYRIDYGNWQESNVFRNVPPGERQVFAREINGCGQTASETFQLIGYPRFFTPNGDGYNDTWKVNENNEDLEIKVTYIFDRYGKLLKQLDPGSAGWDGTFNGRNLPATDYWFKLEYVDSSTGELREFGANFTLKR